MEAMQGTKGNIYSRILGHHPSHTWGGTVGSIPQGKSWEGRKETMEPGGQEDGIWHGAGAGQEMV